jgi:hypothetical protein
VTAFVQLLDLSSDIRGMNSNIQPRSPLCNRPLRQAGQGLDEWLSNVAMHRGLDYLLIPALLWMLAMGSWLQRLGQMPALSWVLLGAAVLTTLWAVVRFRELLKHAGNIKLGRDGERHVGQLLQTLDLPGTRIFHDVPTERGDIDHIVVCERGIYVVETKTWRKRGNEKLDVKAGRIYLRGRPVRSDPVGQVVGAARWLREKLQSETGTAYECQPAVVIPEWFVNRMDEATKSIAWVLEPKGLLKWIRRDSPKLTSEDIAKIDATLARHVRSQLAGELD